MQVVTHDGKWVSDDYGIFTFELPGYEPFGVQVKVHSECPADGSISRDNFVAYASAIPLVTLLSTFGEWYDVGVSEFFQSFSYKELTAPIGTPDLELNLTMTAEGYQLEFINRTTDDTRRFVQTWEEVYSN